MKYAKKDSELRMGFCWKCADAQTIIGEGKDMYDEGSGGTELLAKEATERLKMLIKAGWK